MPSRKDRAISRGTGVTRGNSEYATPAITSAAQTTVHSLARRATSGMNRRTTKVASAKLLMTIPMVEAESPICVP